MTFLVTDACFDCKHMTCVPVCPVDAFHEGPNTLVINPDICVDCMVCQAECPEDAIITELEDDGTWLAFNTGKAKVWTRLI